MTPAATPVAGTTTARRAATPTAAKRGIPSWVVGVGVIGVLVGVAIVLAGLALRGKGPETGRRGSAAVPSGGRRRARARGRAPSRASSRARHARAARAGSGAKASSSVGNRPKFAAKMAIDDDLATCWQEGSQQEKDQWIEVTFDPSRADTLAHPQRLPGVAGAVQGQPAAEGRPGRRSTAARPSRSGSRTRRRRRRSTSAACRARRWSGSRSCPPTRGRRHRSRARPFDDAAVSEISVLGVPGADGVTRAAVWSGRTRRASVSRVGGPGERIRSWSRQGRRRPRRAAGRRDRGRGRARRRAPSAAGSSAAADPASRRDLAATLSIYPCPDSGPALATVGSGQKFLVTGKNADASWVRIYYPLPGRTEAWVTSGPLQIDGSLDDVPVVPCAPVVAGPGASVEPGSSPHGDRRTTAHRPARRPSRPSRRPTAAPPSPASTSGPAIAGGPQRYCEQRAAIGHRQRARDGCERASPASSCAYRKPGAADFATKPMASVAGSDTWRTTLATDANGIAAPGSLRVFVTATDRDPTPHSSRLPTRSIDVVDCANDGPDPGGAAGRARNRVDEPRRVPVQAEGDDAISAEGDRRRRRGRQSRCTTGCRATARFATPG